MKKRKINTVYSNINVFRKLIATKTLLTNKGKTIKL